MCAQRVPRVLDTSRDYLEVVLAGELAGALAGVGAGALAGAVVGVPAGAFAGVVAVACCDPSLELAAVVAGVADVLDADAPERLSVL